MIEMVYSVREVRSEKGTATAMIDGAPVDATVDRLVVVLASDMGEQSHEFRLPIVGADALAAQREEFAPGEVVTVSLARRAAGAVTSDVNVVKAPAMVVAG